MAYVVVARWTAREGEQEAVRASIERLIQPSRAEPGCRLYEPTFDPQDDKVFVLLEIYDDAAAYGVHSSSQHFQQHAVSDAIPRLDSRERSFYETVI
jgi:quinol monooxygenase YgiN